MLSIERQNQLFKKTSILLPKLWAFGLRKLIFGDGYKGLLKLMRLLIVLCVTAGAPLYSATFDGTIKDRRKARVIPVGEKRANYDVVDS